MKKWGAMEGVTKASSFPSLHRHSIISRRDPIPRKAFEIPWRIVSVPSCRQRSNPKIVRGAITREEGAMSLPEKKKKEEEKEKFSWYEQWYPVAPVCDLDKRRPQGKKVIGIEVVVWWDRNDQAWKVFDDNCPHRLAPLSEGRIDAKGRLQCVYHGWCYGGAGDCKFIPQAHPDGPRVENSSKACVGVYPSCVQNGIVWFWPNLEAEYKDIHMKKKPPYIPELDDPSYTKGMSSREAPYSYEILVQNLVDISHVPYAHHGLLSIFDKPTSESKGERDREGGGPLRLDVGRIDASGYSAKLGETGGFYNFTAPCLYTASYSFSGKKVVLAFLCIPVSPHESRVIFASPRNFGAWMDRIIPRWVHHMGENMVFDSDLHLLMVEDRRLTSVGSRNWHKACYVPTKADAMVVAFRRWLNTYGGAEVDWRHKENAVAPPPRIPPREQLFDRYWTHTVNCSSCRVAYERLTALHIALHFFSIASVAVAAAVKHKRYSLLLSVVAVMCFAASKWLEHFVYKTFRYHDYDHAFQLS